MIYRLKHQNELYTVEFEEEGGQIRATINDKELPVEFKRIEDNLYSLIIEGRSIAAAVLKRGKTLEVFLGGELYEFEVASGLERTRAGAVVAAGIYEIKSPMPSRVVKILKNQGDEVKEGEGLVVIEAMKMESELKSPIPGKVTEVRVNQGDAVESGTVLLIVSSE